MEEENYHMDEFSVALSRALDEVGLNEVTVKTRRETMLYIEVNETLFEPSLTENVTNYIFGSQSEGTTTPGLKSDVDSVKCVNKFNVIHDVSGWMPGKVNLLMLKDNTKPGYCRLQVMKSDTPEPETTHNNEHYVSDSRGRVLMKNTYFNISEPLYKRNGPAQTIFLSCQTGFDCVFALRCAAMYELTETWARRRRHGDWPPHNLIQAAINEPVFVVGVGHKLSPKPELEWRISTSLAERCLMFSLNIVQIKCIVLLKMLLKQFVTDVVGCCLSSYHCKTVLLYCMETTEDNFWHEDNLLHCVSRCLEMLHAYVTDCKCSHLILTDINLFDGKVTQTNKHKLLKGLKWLIQYITDCFLNVTIDELGQVLKKYRTNMPNDCLLNSRATNDISRYLLCLKHGTIPAMESMELQLQTYARFTASTSINILQQELCVHYVRNVLKRLEARKFNANTRESEALEHLIDIYSRYQGSLSASMKLSRNAKLQQGTLDLIRKGFARDISARLKLASVLYCNADLEKAESLLKEVEHDVNTSAIQPICVCKLGETSKLELQIHVPYMFAKCVSFNAFEINCAPNSLRYELFKCKRDDPERTPTSFNSWMILAVVDAVPFLCFLQCITYRQLGMNELGDNARQRLEKVIVEGDCVLSHMETAWNLLGQCYEMEHNFDFALSCYKRSLEIRSTKNAAKWLVSILIFKLVQ